MVLKKVQPDQLFGGSMMEMSRVNQDAFADNTVRARPSTILRSAIIETHAIGIFGDCRHRALSTGREAQ